MFVCIYFMFMFVCLLVCLFICLFCFGFSRLNAKHEIPFSANEPDLEIERWIPEYQIINNLSDVPRCSSLSGDTLTHQVYGITINK